MKDKNKEDNKKSKMSKKGEGPHKASINTVEGLKDKPPLAGMFSSRLAKIGREFNQGFKFISKYDLAASIFGSARHGVQHDMYKEATKLAKMLAEEEFTIITGGGPGIMEAANKGAYEADGESVGLCIKLPNEQITNKYVTDSMSFHYFFSRKVMLSFASEVYIFFPGGFGTMDEFFEMITLIQNGKDENILVVLVGEHYWEGLLDWIEKTMHKENETISKEDMDIYNLVDDADEAFDLIKKEMKKRPSFFENGDNNNGN